MRPLIVMFAGVFGLAVGSFLNVVIYRVPRGLSIVKPDSFCPSCNTPLRGRDNIPVVSYLVLRGRCHVCGAHIAARYPAVEGINTLLWIAAAVRFDEVEHVAFACAVSSVLLALAIIDLELKRLPNSIVLTSIVVSVIWVGVAEIVSARPRAFVEALVCGAVAFALFFIIAFVTGGMGFGDVKLAAFIGVVTGRFGWRIAAVAIFSSFIIGGLVAAGLMVAGRKGRRDAIPFGPSMAVAAVLALHVGEGLAALWLPY